MRYNLFRCILPLACLFVAGNLHAKPKKPTKSFTAAAIDGFCQTVAATDSYALQKNELIIDKGNQPAATTTNVSRVIVCRINLFRYNATLTQQKGVVASQALPTNILGPGIGVSTTPAKATNTPAPTKIGLRLDPTASDKDRDILESLTADVGDNNAKAITFTDAQANVAVRLKCYTVLSNAYPSALLTQTEQKRLLGDLAVGTFCLASSPAEMWTTASEIQLAAVRAKAADLGARIATAKTEAEHRLGASAAAKIEAAQSLNDLDLLNTATETRLGEALAKPPDAAAVTAYNASVATAAMWDKRAAFTLAATDEWNQTVTLHCGIEYFGRTESQTVTLTATDFAQPAPVAVTPPFTFTNACLPSLTVSTGLAFSAVRNSTFAFEPGPGTATNATTTQVIGYATDNRITPLFVGQLNYAYLPRERAVQLHVSGGAGVGTSSGGTSGDFFLGNAFSFAHRAVFITPAFQLTSRTRLRDGYKIGDPMGALSSVPTISGWQSGFMVTVTFAVLH